MTSMDFRADHRLGQSQTQTLSPRLQHAVRLLQMSSMDFAAQLRDTLGRNPFLEAEETDLDAADGETDADAHADADADADADGRSNSDSDSLDSSSQHPDDPYNDMPATDRLAEGAGSNEAEFDDASDRDLWQVDTGSGQRGAEDGGLSAMEMMAVETRLNTHLHGQLNVLPLSPRDLTLARTLVESLDDDGYLRTPLEELLSVAALDPPATLQEMEVALKWVQSLEPLGVAARSVGECLQLQLPAIVCPDMRALAQAIIQDHLPALAARDVGGLAKALRQPPVVVEAVCDRIRRLDPRPGWRFGSSRVDYVVPDVVVKRVNGQWVVRLNPAVVPRVRLNQVYAQLFQRHRTAQNAEMGEHLQEARWVMRNVEQRFSTILDVAQAIVKRQRNFFDYGAMAMKPLGLHEIAQEVGIHESTASRVTNNKYMATPMGVFELKYFFSRAMISSNGSACSGTAIRGLIKDVIEAEDPVAPLSDVEITRQLGRQGLVVARRTVTKYRQLLKIEAAERRRRCS